MMISWLSAVRQTFLVTLKIYMLEIENYPSVNPYFGRSMSVDKGKFMKSLSEFKRYKMVDALNCNFQESHLI